MRLIFALPCLLVILNWLWPLPLPLELKLAIAALLIVASQYHFWCQLSSGSVFAPEFPRPLIVLFNWAFSALAFLALLQIVLDIGCALVSVVQWHWVGIPDTLRESIGGLAAVLAAIGVANAMRVPPVRDVTLTIPGLAPSLDGYCLLQLTDLHLSRFSPASWARAVVTRANAAGVDLIVITGDFIDGSVAMRRDDVAPLRDLHAPDGVMAIPGNHEYFFDYAEWMHHLSGLGIQLLLNAHQLITRNGAALAIAGVTDRSAGGHGHEGPDLDAALTGIPPDAPVVLLDHQPQEARMAAERGVVLQLSGHTHGGMILGLDRLVARGNKGFVSGRYSIGQMTLYVGNGTGIWPGFAVRLGRPSEMTRFHLRAG